VRCLRTSLIFEYYEHCIVLLFSWCLFSVCYRTCGGGGWVGALQHACGLNSRSGLASSHLNVTSWIFGSAASLWVGGGQHLQGDPLDSSMQRQVQIKSSIRRSRRERCPPQGGRGLSWWGRKANAPAFGRFFLPAQPSLRPGVCCILVCHAICRTKLTAPKDFPGGPPP
jgi:hypothetical protein